MTSPNSIWLSQWGPCYRELHAILTSVRKLPDCRPRARRQRAVAGLACPQAHLNYTGSLTRLWLAQLFIRIQAWAKFSLGFQQGWAPHLLVCITLGREEGSSIDVFHSFLPGGNMALRKMSHGCKFRMKNLILSNPSSVSSPKHSMRSLRVHSPTGYRSWLSGTSKNLAL